MTRYVVIGAGAVGGTLAAELVRAGRTVTVVARGAHLEALQARGLRYLRPDGERQIRLDVVGGPDEVTLREDDVLVLTTKVQDAEAVLQRWASLPVQGTERSAAEVLPIVLLQNGLEGPRLALRRFAHVIDAVVMIASSYVTPGEVVSPSTPTVGGVYLGWASSDPTRKAPQVPDLVGDDLRAAHFAVQVVPDIQRWKAGKLLGNLAHNLDALYQPSELRAAAGRAIRAEAEAILAAAGVDTADIDRESRLALSGLTVTPIPGHERGGSSTWQSLSRSGSSEADFLYGEIALQARLVGRPAPLNTAVQQRIDRLARDGGAPGQLDDADLLRTLPSLRSDRVAVLIEAKELHDELLAGSPPVLLDVRWALGDPNGLEHYRAGHIPGAVYVDLDTELADLPEPLRGRHPLPDVAALESAARRWGISDGQPVVVYDNTGGLSAARAWWLLRWAGVREVRILDGALPAWTAAGFELATGEESAGRGDVTLSPGHLPVLTADEAQSLAQQGFLLDARAAERYRGEVEPIDPRAGHIPGAFSAPTGQNLDPNQRFLPSDRLRSRFEELGITDDAPVGVYCGSGVTAAHQVAALAVAGIDAALYPGSWSAWSSDPDRPVATRSSPTARTI